MKIKLDGKIKMVVCSVVSSTHEVEAYVEWIDGEPRVSFGNIELQMLPFDRAYVNHFLLVSNHSSIPITGVTDMPLPVVIDNSCMIQNIGARTPNEDES